MTNQLFAGKPMNMAVMPGSTPHQTHFYNLLPTSSKTSVG